MPVFPSVAWFDAVRAIVNNDENYKKLGTCDAEIGIDTGEKVFKLTFEAFECTGAEEISRDEEHDLDFTLVQPYEGWKEMIENIKQNGHADLHHTLNSIDLERPEEFARSDDYFRRDAFYRFNQTFQDFFNASARIETQFEPQPAAR